VQKHRTAALVLTIVGALLCALAIGGIVAYRFYLLRPWLFHPLLFGITGGVALALAIVLGIRKPLLRWLGASVCVLAAGTVAFAGWFATAFQPDLTEQSRQQSADGTLELVVYTGTAFVAPDPVWELRVLNRDGLLAQQFDLGCVNADSQSLNAIGWSGQRTIRAVLSSGIVDIAVDGDGRPDRTVDGGC
jgi:hypothetical protein